MGTPTEIGLWSDFLGSFDLGVNSDVPPISLPKNQLAFATNATVRGAFITHRPPYQSITLDTTLNGLFQGACYYKPDAGPESIIASIAGRFYKIIPAGTLGIVSDITPEETNDPTAPMAWLWQSELFMLINDGLNQTAIYNNVSTTRAIGDELVAEINTGGTLPAEGNSLSVTFTQNYTGPLNTPLYLFSDALKSSLLATVEVNIASSTAGGYKVRLTNIDDTPGNPVTFPEDIMIINTWSGFSSQSVAFSARAVSPNSGIVEMGVHPPYTGPLNAVIEWPNSTPQAGVTLKTWVRAISPGGGILTLERTDNTYNSVSILNNAPGSITGGGSDVLVAVTAEDFTVPQVGSHVDVAVDRQVNYNGQTVYINGKRYTIEPVPPPTTTTLYIKTINPIQPNATISAGATLWTIPQIPVGTIGAYGLGRNWIALPDRQSYVASDIVGSSSGSIAYNFRDSVLNVTENNYLAGGGVFRVPGAGQQINTMAFPATLDSSLGQGPLQVMTQSIVFSCNAPVQRSEWQNMVNPIQTQSLVGAGSLGECAIVNGDIWFRAPNGVYSLKLARQDFIVSYANTPQSTEMNRVLIDDDRNLLGFFRASVFDNRLLYTATPTQHANGVMHSGVIALNLDPNSGVGEKLPPRYDGIWTGLNVLKLVSGLFNGVERLFAVVINDDGNIGLTEILTTKTQNTFDDGDPVDGRIQWSFESPGLFHQPDTRRRQLLRLSDGEIFVDKLVGTVQFSVYFRPDYMSEWTLWHNWDVTNSPTFQPRMGLGTPTTDGDEATGRPNCVGYHFQIMVVIKGSCVFMGANLFASTQADTSIAPPIVPSEGLQPLTT